MEDALVIDDYDVKDRMEQAAEELEGYNGDRMELYDADLEISSDGGKTWSPAEPQDIPPEGLTVTLPYPEGLDGVDFDYVVIHMFAHTADGHTAGDTEVLIPAKTADGLRVTFTSRSPLAILWKAREEPCFLQGDVNGDSQLNIADAVCIVNWIVGKPNAVFIEKVVDINDDGLSNIADAVTIVNLVVGGSNSVEETIFMPWDSLDPE